MDLEQAKRLINEYANSRTRKKYVKNGRTGERYHRCENDILNEAKPKHDYDVLHTANNLIPSNFFHVLNIQKASYAFGNPTVVTLENEKLDDAVIELQGEKWGKVLKQLCINAACWGDAWMQYWIDQETGFHYGIVDNEDFIPVWGGNLNDELILGIKRATGWIDPETGTKWDLYELWTPTQCYFYRHESGETIDTLQEENRFTHFNVDTNSFEETNCLEHEYGEVPFIQFKNNSEMLNDLAGIKGSIDAYDKCRSLLQNNIEDCENILVVLTGYGDQDPAEFWENANKNHLITIVDTQIEDPEGDIPLGKSGIDKLVIEPPIAATQLNLELTRKAIFEQGGGVDPTPEVLGNTSGEALKHKYNLLELKTICMEDEFRIGINRLIRAMCLFLGVVIEKSEIKQTWKRSRINNDTELIANARNSLGILSLQTILENHPYVKDVSEEEKRMQEEAQKEKEAADQDTENYYANEMINDQNQRERVLARTQQDDGGSVSEDQ